VKFKIEVSSDDYILIKRTLRFGGYNDLVDQIEQQDPANDGPEVAILNAERQS
jgi:antitoxin component of MazEF toxin-antitoxin module